MTYRELTQKLRRLECIELPRRGGGSHRKWLNPALNQATVIPDWGNKDLKTGTIRAIVQQLGLEWDIFKQI